MPHISRYLPRAGTLLLIVCTLILAGSAPAAAQTPPAAPADTTPAVYVFGRDDCGFCKQQFEWLEEAGIPYNYENILEDEEAAELFRAIAKKHGVSRVTPITIVGPNVFVGFNGPNTTGARIEAALANIDQTDIRTPREHLAHAPEQTVTAGGGCTDIRCEAAATSAYLINLPLLGEVDLKAFSLFSLSALLGTIDGFNPCAMWVLITFLVLLSQAGSRRKMVFLAGLFILAEGVMYNLILNVWYKTWDFVALDQIVTPLVGLVAVGGGLFFLYRYYKNRNVALVCDISDIETQQKTINRFKAVATQPITLASVAAILLIAFSVNVIEFACSVGIPQAFTKILELNDLTFLERQFYILVYTFGYMLDDLIVFALAIWGYGKLQAHGQKFSQLSLLLGGLLMLVLGAMLVLNPSFFVLD